MTRVSRARYWHPVALALLAGVTACKGEHDPARDTLPVRPVLSIVVKETEPTEVGFAGAIQSQNQADLSFRVIGRMIARTVDVGDLVKVGQVVARIDPQVLDLAVRASLADLEKARSQLVNTVAAEARTATLLANGITPQATFDTARQSREAAAASVQQAEANLDKAREQRSYASLTTEMDGVVTSLDAEVGQTVSPGRKVLTVARTDKREAVVDIPEEAAPLLATGTPFIVELQTDTGIRSRGVVREIAPQADAATRTRRVKITLETVRDAFRLGATIRARTLTAEPVQGFDIPRTALLERDGRTLVWLVDQQAKTVWTVPVVVAARGAGDVRIASGIAAGDRVVTAGVNSLAEGQSVRLDGRPSR